VAQQEIFNDKLAVATGERSPTGKAGYVVEGGLSSSFDFDDLIQRLAVRAREGNKRRWPAASHLRPPIPSRQFLIVTHATLRVGRCQAFVAALRQNRIRPKEFESLSN
jgi:hypothetical protein